MYKLLPILGVLLLYSSCITINGIGSDYKKLNASAKPYIISYKEGKDTLNNIVYPITAEEIKQQFKKHNKVMVYIFVNSCSRSACYPLNSFKQWADQNNYKIFMVMTGYGGLGTSLSQYVKPPLYVVNHTAYNTNWQGKYLKKFRSDLLVNEPNANEIIKEFTSIYLFENGKLKQTSNDLLLLEPKFSATFSSF